MIHKKQWMIIYAIAVAILFAAVCLSYQKESHTLIEPDIIPRTIMQENALNIPELGDVSVRLLKIADRPSSFWEMNRFQIVSKTTGRIFYVQDEEEWNVMGYDILDIKGLPRPLIMLVKVSFGGSDNGYETDLIAYVNGRFQIITELPPANNLDGFYLGDLGGEYGLGAITWNFIWDTGGHYDPHHYGFVLYKYDPETYTFKEFKSMKTKEVYETGQDAMKEVNLPRYKNFREIPQLERYR